MATSALPAALSQLVEIFRAAPGLAEAQISDGPPVADQSGRDLIAVGWRPGDEPAAELQQEFAYAGGRRRNEDLSIGCWLDTWSGDADFPTTRARAFALLAVIETAIRNTDATPDAAGLNGAVQWGHLTSGSLSQNLTDQGAEVGIAFTISCRARI